LTIYLTPVINATTAGIIGECCPTRTGIQLGCCPTIVLDQA
jgi:hypothetical protein